MPTGLERRHGTKDIHFITISCFRHTHILKSPKACNSLQKILEETRQKYLFQILGYVFMSTHIHLLITEPESAKLSTAIQVIKQRFSRLYPDDEIWEPRYHDFNVFTTAKEIEKLNYIHQNPVTAKLAATPAAWPWSSYHSHTTHAPHPVKITTWT